MPTPLNSDSSRLVLVCQCRELNGQASSRFCPDCGMPRSAYDFAASTNRSTLSEQLHSSISELSVSTVSDDSVDSRSAIPTVITNSNTFTNDQLVALPDTALDGSATWQTGQAFNLRTVMLSATAVFTAVTFLVLAASQNGSNSRNTNSANSRSVSTQPLVSPETPGGVRVAAAASTASRRGGALVTNAASPRPRADFAPGRQIPRFPTHGGDIQRVAPATVSSLPLVESAETATAPVENDSLETSTAPASGGPVSAAPLGPVGSRPSFVNVSPVDGSPDPQNGSTETGSSTRYAGTNGYIIVNGRVAMDGTAPQISIQSPNANGNYVGYFPVPQGLAESPAGVGAVEIEIERMAKSGSRVAYWDGQTWASSPTRLATTVSGNVWTYRGGLPNNDALTAGYYRVKVYAAGFRGPERRPAPSAVQRIRVFPKGPAV